MIFYWQQWPRILGIWEPVCSLEVSQSLSWVGDYELEAWELLGRLALIWSSLLSRSLLTCVTEWRWCGCRLSFWPKLLFLGFPPSYFGLASSLPTKCCLLWGWSRHFSGQRHWLQAVTVVQSRKPSWSRRDRQGLFVRILYIDFWRKERGLRDDFSIEILWNALHNRTKLGKEKGL